MAFTVAVLGETVFGDKRLAVGTAVSTGADVGGNIVTGLQQVHSFAMVAFDSAIVANAPAVDETLPLASGTVTIAQDADTGVYWVAIGV